MLGELRLAVGCVGPKATRLPELEARLQGLSAADATRVLAESKPYLTEQLEPIGDLLGAADYKIAIPACCSPEPWSRRSATKRPGALYGD